MVNKSQYGVVKNMPRGTVLITGGAGIVGRYATDFLARSSLVKKVVIADIKKKEGETVKYNAQIGSATMWNYPKVIFEKVDLTDIDAVVSLLKKHNPDVILQVATMLSSYFYAHLAEKVIKDRGLPYEGHLAGHTIAKDFVFTYYVMQALKEANINARVVNLAFPDITNYILGKIKLEPTIGAGTTDLTATGIQLLVAEALGVPIHNIDIRLVAHHAIRVIDPKKVPYYLKIMYNSEDITSQFDTIELFRKCIQITNYGIIIENSSMTASSAVSNVLALLHDNGIIKHSPGPGGLPGGWPVRINYDHISIMLPKEISVEKAIEINLKGMKYDGIDRVESDGTVVFTKDSVDYMKDVLKIDWPTVKPDEALDMAKDLIKAYKQLAEEINYKGIFGG